jgi:hypothetical protein
MKSKLLCCLVAATLGVAIVAATPATAFRGGFGGGGFRGGRFDGFHGGEFSGLHGAVRGPMFMGRSAFVPGAGHFAHAPSADQHFFVNRADRDDHFRQIGRFDQDDHFRHFNRDDRFFFRNGFFFNRFNNFAFAGAPFTVGFVGLDYGYGYGWPYYGYDGCWQQVWTDYGSQWVNVCDNNAY